jgi:hypothetical protein
MPERWLAFDIGCIECGEGSAVIGTYATQEAAQQAADTAEEQQKQDWRGQHRFEVYDLEASNA